ncbi:MAG: hypothetical protein ACMUJM_25875 [bacterium]
MKKVYLVISFMVVVLLVTFSRSRATTVNVFTDLSAWESQVFNIETFKTTANNILKANQVNSEPGSNAKLDSYLTFDSSNTGLSWSFELKCKQNDARFTFDDDEGYGNLINFDNALSVGDIDDYENDNWRIWLTDGTLRAFGVQIKDSGSYEDESFWFYNYSISGNPIASICLNDHMSLDNDSQFFGFVTDFDFDYVYYDESYGNDDIAIADLRFATPLSIPEPIPEPPYEILYIICMVVLYFIVPRTIEHRKG